MNSALTVLLFLFTSAHAAEPVRIQIPADPQTLDPALVTDIYGYNIAANTVETLMRNDQEGRITKALAKAYTISKDGLTYTFDVRDDARWSDGTPITAEDVRRGLLHALDPKTGAADADLLLAIKGAAAYYNGQGPVDKVAITASGQRLKLLLERPDTALLMTMSMPLAGPRHPKAKATWSLDEPSSGAYVLRAYTPEQSIELVPNPYHTKAGQRPITFRILRESAAAFNLFSAGKLDVLSSVEPGTYNELDAQKEIVTFPSAAVLFMAFNVKKPPFDQSVWRRAIAGAIDRAGLAKLVMRSHQATTSYLPRVLDGALETSTKQFENDIATIRALKTKPRLEVIYSSSESGNIIMQKVQADLKKQLGVELALNGTEWKSYLARTRARTASLFFQGMSAPFNDPASHLRFFYYDQRSNGNGSLYNEQRYQEIVDRIARTPTGPARTDLIRRAQKILVEEDAVVIPLVELTKVLAVKPTLKNFHVNPYSVFALDEIR